MAIKMKTEVTLRADATCPSHSRTDVSVRDLQFAIDEPVERGGTNSGPTPTETALAALIACTNVIGNKCAAKLGVDIGHLVIEASCAFDRRGVTLTEEIDIPFKQIDLIISYDGTAGDDHVQRVAADVRKFCPLAKLFRQAGTELNETWRRSE